MGKEIERKFLVSGDDWRKRSGRAKEIQQAYLTLNERISLRVRIVGKSKAYLTIKSPLSRGSRLEFEYPIPFKDAGELMKLRKGRLIKKRRHLLRAGKRTIEIDVFKGDHRGLVIAEVELPTKRTKFIPPDWLGREVTEQKKYNNANLAQQSWKKTKG